MIRSVKKHYRNKTIASDLIQVTMSLCLSFWHLCVGAEQCVELRCLMFDLISLLSIHPESFSCLSLNKGRGTSQMCHYYPRSHSQGLGDLLYLVYFILWLA